MRHAICKSSEVFLSYISGGVVHRNAKRGISTQVSFANSKSLVLLCAICSLLLRRSCFILGKLSDAAITVGSILLFMLVAGLVLSVLWSQGMLPHTRYAKQKTSHGSTKTVTLCLHVTIFMTHSINPLFR